MPPVALAAAGQTRLSRIEVTWPVPGKLGALILQSLRENVETDFKVESARGNGMRVTIDFVHKVPLNKAN